MNDQRFTGNEEDAELDATIDEALRVLRGLLVTAVICGVATAGSAVSIALWVWTRR